MIKLATILAFLAIAVSVSHAKKTKKFAFDSSFPEDGSEWKFEVVLDEKSTALAELEAGLLDKLNMSPIFRCGGGLFGVRWMGRSFFKNIPQEPLLRLYKLVLEDANPPDEDTFIVRHQILGFKLPLSSRHDKFTCAKRSKGKVCKKWNSEGYVKPSSALKLTKGATEDPIYYQTLTLVPKSNTNPKVCPIVNSSWWCLWIFCPNSSEYRQM